MIYFLNLLLLNCIYTEYIEDWAWYYKDMSPGLTAMIKNQWDSWQMGKITISFVNRSTFLVQRSTLKYLFCSADSRVKNFLNHSQAQTQEVMGLELPIEYYLSWFLQRPRKILFSQNNFVVAVWILSILLQKNAEIFWNDDCRNKCKELTIWIKS